VHYLLGAAVRTARPRLTSGNYPVNREPGTVGAGADPSAPGNRPATRQNQNRHETRKRTQVQAVTKAVEPDSLRLGSLRALASPGHWCALAPTLLRGASR
jgi:hypothetical protein